MHLEVSALVRAPRESVYAAYTDFESIPKWAKVSGPVKVSVERDAATLRSGSSARRLTLNPPSAVYMSSGTAFTSTSRVVRFEEVPEGTKVTASLDVRVKRPWGMLVTTRSKEEFEPEIQEELSSFARYVERLSHHDPASD